MNIPRKVKITLRSIFHWGIRLVDNLVPKSPYIWVFPVYFIGDGNFCDNMLAVYEATKKDKKIKKIILTRKKKIPIQGNNTVTLPMRSFRAIYYLLRSNVIFVQHSIWLDLSWSLFQIRQPLNRKIINLWHGIPIKDLSHNNTGIINNRSLTEFNNYYFFCSSIVDKTNMQNAFNKTPKENFLVTGLPRNDHLLVKEFKLPTQYQEELKILKVLLNDKKLILYAPTYRENSEGSHYYKFSSTELQSLRKYCKKNNYLLGVRYHIYRCPNFLHELYKNDFIVDLSSNVIPDIRMLLRETNLLITDYSSTYVDALYIGVKCISFAYDFEHYLSLQRGFFFNLEKIFAGEIFKSFSELSSFLNKYGTNFPINAAKTKKTKKILFRYTDTNNSNRVVEQVKKIAWQ